MMFGNKTLIRFPKEAIDGYNLGVKVMNTIKTQNSRRDETYRG